MTTNEWSNIELIINEMEKILIEEKILNLYSGQDLSQIDFGNFTVMEFQRYFHEIIEKIKSIKDNQGYKLLPSVIGNLNLYSNLANLKSYCDQNTFGYASQHMELIIQYLIVCNVWKVSHRVPAGIKISALEKTSVLLSKEIEILNLKSKQTEENILNKADELSILNEKLKVKSAEIDEIKNTSDTKLNMINDVLSNANVLKEKIVAIVNRSDEYLVEIEEKDLEINKLKKHIETLGIEYEERIDKVNQKIEFLEAQNIKFEEQNQYLDTLIHRTVGANLFRSFEIRKDELKKSTTTWAIASVLCGIVIFGLIIFFFKSFQLNGSLEINAIFLLISSIKVFPFLVLLFFSISQFSRERKFQEEYAFKSAVALSLNDYASRINEDNKDEFIISSVKNIYESPIRTTEKSGISANRMIKMVTAILNKNGIKVTLGEDNK